MLVAEPGLTVAGLLRQLRAEARLTQEELAEAATLSPRSISDLERGINRTARKDTAELLAGALGLAEPARAVFVAGGPRPAPPPHALAALSDAAVPGSAGPAGAGLAGAGLAGAGPAGVAAEGQPVTGPYLGLVS